MMEDQGQDSNSPSHSSAPETNEPVRSRWTPKPEQILILESIFNSGMVNPPKEETVKIRKLLEKFGPVGDANVFYWFQNRRSRSRRRQRQMQASLEQRNQLMRQQASGSAIQYESGSSTANTTASVGLDSSSLCFNSSPPFCLAGSSSTCGVMGGQEGCVGSLFPVTAQLAFPEVDRAATSSVLYPSDASNLHYQPGVITVFINGIPTEVPRGPLDTKTMFGEDVILVYSSGVPVPTNGFDFLLQSLQQGESYFLVPRPT